MDNLDDLKKQQEENLLHASRQFNLVLTPFQVRILFSILSDHCISVNSKLKKFQYVDEIKCGLYNDWVCEFKTIDDILNKLVLGLSKDV